MASLNSNCCNPGDFVKLNNYFKIHCKDKLHPNFFVSVKLFRKKVFFPTAHANACLDKMVNTTANGNTVEAQEKLGRLES